jgi:hypothetical protein
MNKVLLTFFLMIICILVMMFISPIIDHFFYIDEKIEKMSKLKIFGLIVLHILILGCLILSIHHFIINNYLDYFNIVKHGRYIKLLIDLVITLTLVGLQRNLLYKIQYLSRNHPIRSKLVE